LKEVKTAIRKKKRKPGGEALKWMDVRISKSWKTEMELGLYPRLAQELEGD